MMTRTGGPVRTIVTIVTLAATLVVVGGIVWWQNQTDDQTQNEVTPAITTENSDEQSTDDSIDQQDTVIETTDETIDPTTMATIDIDPLEITVAYTKGLPGFEYAVKRTAQGTQYVEFSTSELVGTKCTDDTGVFASIIVNPTSDEDQATVSQSVIVNDISYGLSLPSDTCTSDPVLFDQYQTAFTDGFGLLRAI